ncbi:inosine/xanthosine triphosphatase, partial [Methanocaldococcus infernus]
MKVAVGSTNPVKVRAVEKAFLTFFQEVEVVPLNVSSGVSPHPKSLEETYRGALNRAKESYKLGNFDYSVGIEAGILKLNNHYLDVHVSVIYDGERESVGLSSAFEYPKFAIEEIFKGREG